MKNIENILYETDKIQEPSLLITNSEIPVSSIKQCPKLGENQFLQKLEKLQKNVVQEVIPSKVGAVWPEGHQGKDVRPRFLESVQEILSCRQRLSNNCNSSWTR